MTDKAKLNFIIDALMFICMTAIVGFGILMKFILIPGKERWGKYGRSVELLWLGMDRHEWGTIHLSIGFMLLGLLALHIVLHWKVIVGLFQKMVGNQKARRICSRLITSSYCSPCRETGDTRDGKRTSFFDWPGGKCFGTRRMSGRRSTRYWS